MGEKYAISANPTLTLDCRKGNGFIPFNQASSHTFIVSKKIKNAKLLKGMNE